MNEKSVFETLNEINVSDYIEKKNGLSYVSWAYAWKELKKIYPNAQYKVYENEQGWNYFTDGRTCWVKTGVIVEGLEHIEYLPVMDNSNNSIPFEKVTSFDVNKTIQRSLTKAIGRHGLGLYVYAGEDLPEDAPKQQLSDSVRLQATTYNVNLTNLATYLKKSVNELTDEDVLKAVEMKKEVAAKAKKPAEEKAND